MARLTGIISKLNGSAGNLTFRQKSGKTIVSEKITQTTNAKTELQLKHRMKWANIIREYQVLQPYMKLAFGGTRNGRNDHNKSVSYPKKCLKSCGHFYWKAWLFVPAKQKPATMNLKCRCISSKIRLPKPMENILIVWTPMHF